MVPPEKPATKVVPHKKPPAKRGTKRPNPSDTVAESSDRGEVNVPITEDSLIRPAKCIRAPKIPQTPSRDPLPSRARNNHLGKPDAPRPKRSSAEVQEAMKKLEEIEAQKAEIEARKVQLYAELEMQDEAAQNAKAHSVIKTLKQVQEEFTFSEIDAEESTSEEEEDGNAGKKAEASVTKRNPKKAVCGL